MSRGVVEHRLAVDVRRIARNGWTSGAVRRFVGDVVCSSVGYVLDLEGASLVLTWASSGVPYRLQNRLMAKLAPMKRDIVK